MVQTLRIEGPFSERAGNDYIICYRLNNGEWPDLTFKVVDAPAELDTSRMTIHPALIALLIPAMEEGLDIELGSAADPRLITNLTYHVLPLLRLLLPYLHPITIANPKGAEFSETAPETGSITAMSGGVDSFYTVKRYYYDLPQTAPERLTQLIFNDLGAHGGDGARAVARYHYRVDRARQLAQKMGLPLWVIESNMDAYYRKTTFNHSHTLRNVAASMVVAQYHSAFLYSSGISFTHCRGGQSYDIAATDPLLLPYLNSAHHTYKSVGGETDRTDKTLQLLDLPYFDQFVDVCVSRVSDGQKNCGNCFKCARFLLIAEQEGVLDRFRERFEMEAYRANHTRLLAMILHKTLRRNTDPNELDILRYIRAQNIPIPPTAYLYAAPEILRTYLPKAVKQFYRKFLHRS